MGRWSVGCTDKGVGGGWIGGCVRAWVQQHNGGIGLESLFCH